MSRKSVFMGARCRRKKLHHRQTARLAPASENAVPVCSAVLAFPGRPPPSPPPAKGAPAPYRAMPCERRRASARVPQPSACRTRCGRRPLPAWTSHFAEMPYASPCVALARLQHRCRMRHRRVHPQAHRRLPAGKSVLVNRPAPRSVFFRMLPLYGLSTPHLRTWFQWRHACSGGNMGVADNGKCLAPFRFWRREGGRTLLGIPERFFCVFSGTQI